MLFCRIMDLDMNLDNLSKQHKMEQMKQQKLDMRMDMMSKQNMIQLQMEIKELIVNKELLKLHKTKANAQKNTLEKYIFKELA